MSVFDEINQKVAMMMAQLVEQAAAMARAHGFEFPRDYQFGVGVRISGPFVHLSLRINDFKYQFRPIAVLNQDSLKEGLFRASAELVQEYTHARLSISREKAQKMIELMKNSESWEKRVNEIVDAQLQTAVFKDLGKRSA